MPRLELCAALVLAKLIEKVTSSLRVNFARVMLWSDSQITLAWLQTPPYVLKIFVANRVSQIHELTCGAQWSYVPTSSNPAFIVSRGISPNDMASAQLWWNGPSWLSTNELGWPEQPEQFIQEVPDMRTAVICANIKTPRESIVLNKFSRLNRLLRVVAYYFRFTFNAKLEIQERKYGVLTAQEINKALIAVVRNEQSQCYAEELRQIKNQNQVKSSSPIVSLAPFLDEDNLIRVEGRLQRSQLPYEARHPIILDGRKHLTNLLFRDAHIRLGHAGVQHIMHNVRERFWPVRGKNAAKSVVRDCVRCFRAHPKNINQQMGILPKSRVTPTFPFENTGVDYAGPFFIKNHKGRGARITKCYLSLFVCLETKAIHLELVSDLSIEAFMAALKRFISRRGKPNKFMSDNGTNFVGAARELKELVEILKSEQEKIGNFLNKEGITWEFIPPNSPHFGGIWEAGVKRAKFHIKRVLNEVKLTFDDFYTFTCQVEAILNSRPLSPLSDDPRDLDPLTPAHFLIGRSQTAVPEPSLQHLAAGRLSTYQHLQQLIQSFWTRWIHEYLQQLQTRHKWKLPAPYQLQVNDVVLLREDNQPPLSWSMGRVIKTYQGPDHTVRVAEVQTKQGIFKRAVTKLYPLPTALKPDIPTVSPCPSVTPVSDYNSVTKH